MDEARHSYILSQSSLGGLVGIPSLDECVFEGQVHRVVEIIQ
jgi:hypothetical protein